ncbi:hypothetical protein Y032_0126g1354 [Ancylostoma ceylanicum]|uniref:Uncharacterized protein n=1 Tax=Ancylostoma ceylanicum TaxID=53326 RepID=A0A016T8M0_9BILA|nr:hypothetical protein Y032_0126g1354 [Ancylostoma ceylanicum]
MRWRRMLLESRRDNRLKQSFFSVAKNPEAKTFSRQHRNLDSFLELWRRLEMKSTSTVSAPASMSHLRFSRSTSLRNEETQQLKMEFMFASKPRT